MPRTWPALLAVIASALSAEAIAEELPPGVPSAAASETPLTSSDLEPHRNSNRDVSLVTGLTAVEGPMFGVLGLAMTGVAISEIGCDSSADFCIAGPVFGILGPSALVASSFSISTLVRAVQERRRRLAGKADLTRSIRFNRLAIAYDSIFTSLPLATGAAAIGAPFAEGDTPGGAWGYFAFATIWGGLHAWSLATNVRALRRGKRANDKGGPRFTGMGVVW